MSKGKSHDCDAVHSGKTHYEWLQDSHMSHNTLGEIFTRPDKRKDKIQFAKDNKEKGEVGTWREKRRTTTTHKNNPKAKRGTSKTPKRTYNHGGRHQHD